MGDPERYRQQEEVRKWQLNDPIGIFRQYLETNQIASDEELDKIDQYGKDLVDEAVRFAEASPEPGPEELFRHIYVEESLGD